MGKGYQIDFLSEDLQIKEFLVKINKPVNQNCSKLNFAPYSKNTVASCSRERIINGDACKVQKAVPTKCLQSQIFRRSCFMRHIPSAERGLLFNDQLESPTWNPGLEKEDCRTTEQHPQWPLANCSLSGNRSMCVDPIALRS